MRDGTKLAELMDVLEKGGVWTTDELSDELGVDADGVRNMVHNIRRKFLNGEDVPYVYSAAVGGYTLDGDKVNVVFESKRRMAMGYGVLVNGVFVFKRCKKIASTAFKALNIQYKPKALTIAQLTHKK